jgi:excisionase family DNA binding protein
MDRLAVSFDEAAKALGVSRDVIRKMVADGRLAVIETGTARRVIPIRSLELAAEEAIERAERARRNVQGLKVVGGEARAGP